MSLNKELHLTEGRGTGIPNIRKAMEANASPEPVFETDEQCTYFLTVLLVNPEVSDQDNDYNNEQIWIVFKYCFKPRTREEILKRIGLKNHFDNYKKYIEPLVNNAWIKMTIPDKPTSKNQRYITTEKGKRIISKKNYDVNILKK